MPYRQVVLSVPYRLRFHLARDGRLLSQILRAHLQTVVAWQRSRGRAVGIADGQSGAVTFVQRFGGALNLNVHFHSLLPNGLDEVSCSDGFDNDGDGLLDCVDPQCLTAPECPIEPIF